MPAVTEYATVTRVCLAHTPSPQDQHGLREAPAESSSLAVGGEGERPPCGTEALVLVRL